MRAKKADANLAVMLGSYRGNKDGRCERRSQLTKMRQSRQAPDPPPCCSSPSAPGIRIRRPKLVLNLYSITTNHSAISALFRVVNWYVGNLAPDARRLSGLQGANRSQWPRGRELVTARWGMPSSSKALMDATKKRAEKLQAKGKLVDFKQLLRMEPDARHDQHPQREVKALDAVAERPSNRCVVPLNSFSEFNKAEGGDIWFALDETRPLACFVGIWTNWTSVRKVKEGETTNDLYAFLTTGRTPRSAPSIPRRCL